MDIQADFSRNTLVLRIADDELRIKISSTFYQKSQGKDSYRMFFDKPVNEKIRKFVFKHRDKLNFRAKIKYLFSRNTISVRLDDDIESLVPKEVLSAYLTLTTDSSTVEFVD